MHPVIQSIKSQHLTPDKELELAKTCGAVFQYGCSPETELALAEFVSQDQRIETLKDHVRLLSQVDDPVIIYGDSGTGKQLIAKALHGSRKKFLQINCAGMPETLFESELFGHKKGAFSGACVDKEGLMVSANGGTLFLDEVAEMPPTTQAKLLCAIQNREVRPVGSNESIPITCRIVSATHHNLSQDIEDNRFRFDLYSRLSTFELEIPSLASRGDDEIVSIFIALCPNYPHDDIMLFLATDEISSVRTIQKLIRRWQVLNQHNLEPSKF